jgi:hypothetical protein
MVPRSTAENAANLPPKLPMGVRVADNMNTLLMYLFLYLNGQKYKRILRNIYKSGLAPIHLKTFKIPFSILSIPSISLHFQTSDH